MKNFSFDAAESIPNEKPRKNELISPLLTLNLNFHERCKYEASQKPKCEAGNEKDQYEGR